MLNGKKERKKERKGKETEMYNTHWIERRVNSQLELSPEETALRATYLAAQKIAFSLVCASNQFAGVNSPDVTACATIVREAVNKPEKDRANAIKAAALAVLDRQTDFISTRLHYLQHAGAWESIRPTLVAQLEAVAISKEEPIYKVYGVPPYVDVDLCLNKWSFGPLSLCKFVPPYVDVDLCLNCEAVAALIDQCDLAVVEATQHQYSRATQKYAEVGFQKVFDALAAEVAGQNWIFNARCASRDKYSADILGEARVEKVSSTELPAEYLKCCALVTAREEFERVFCYHTSTSCRTFHLNGLHAFNDSQLSESLLAAMPDVPVMQRIEHERDTKLRIHGRNWRAHRDLVDRCHALFVKVAELLPEAVTEAAAIDDEKMRRRAQNLCLFAARRLKENQKYIRECDLLIGYRDNHSQDVSGAVGRGHQALVERIRSKEIYRPSSRCREQPYWG